MAEEKETAVDLDAAPIPEETSEQQPKKETPSVDARPMHIMDTMGVKPEVEATDVLTQALGGAPEKPTSTNEGDIVDKNAAIPAAAEQIVADTLDDLDLNINQLCVGKRSLEYINKVLHDLYPTEEAQKAASKDPMSLFNLLIKAFRDGWGSNQLSSLVDCVTEKNGNEQAPCDHLISKDSSEIGSLSDSITHDVHNPNIDLTGETARNSFMASIAGLKRIKLLNSGFWVTIRRPFIYELQDIFDAADLEQKEVGYSIGPHFALIADLYIKKRFVESLIKYRIIRDSNLKDIFKDDNFIKALSFHDYETLVQGVLSLMTRKGLRARVVCPECKRVTLLDKIDINSSLYVNHDLVTPDMSTWWSKTKDEKGNKLFRSLKDIQTYREKVLGFTHTFDETFESAKIRVTLHEPTMSDYFTIGETIVSKIQEVIDEKATNDENRRRIMLANLAAHTYHMLTPWVSKIEQINEEGNVLKRTSDFETILSMFDITMQENSMRPLIELNKFLAKSKISYVGTFALECPYCHAKPDVGANQFYPLEVQTIFFGHLFRLLPAELMPPES